MRTNPKYVIGIFGTGPLSLEMLGGGLILKNEKNQYQTRLN